jgi:hypothetical protein
MPGLLGSDVTRAEPPREEGQFETSSQPETNIATEALGLSVAMDRSDDASPSVH